MEINFYCAALFFIVPHYVENAVSLHILSRCYILGSLLMYPYPFRDRDT